MFKPCVVIPIHNHKDGIPKVIARIEQYALPCLIVNDGSDQATCETLEQLVTTHSFVTLIHRHQNGGKGAAVIDGLKQAASLGYSHAIQVDADGQHQLNDIPKFLQAAKSNPQALVLGLPEFDDSAPKGRLYGRKITQFFIRIETLSSEIQDALCGFRCYPLQATAKLLNSKRFTSKIGFNLGQKMDFDPEIAVRLLWLGLPIISIKTAVKYHHNGLSHFHLFEDNALISWMHTRLITEMLFHLPRILFNRKKYQNNQSQDWHTKKERGAKIAMQLLLSILKISGRPLVNFILYPVIGYFVLSDKKRRNESKDYLQ
ncbi:MAG: glycosyltransferase family 2 protein, partial [Methylococcales bacterium]|nr:glycosyltransferase family 2 protein [Methylococcales bacterium]